MSRAHLGVLVRLGPSLPLPSSHAQGDLPEQQLLMLVRQGAQVLERGPAEQEWDADLRLVLAALLLRRRFGGKA